MIEKEVLVRIQQLLDFKHWTLYKLAKKSGIPYSSLNNIFNRQTCPTVVTLEKICNGFDISISECNSNSLIESVSSLFSKSLITSVSNYINHNEVVSQIMLVHHKI